MRPINEIIIHTTATRPAWMQRNSTHDKVAEIRRWHVEDRGWRDIGYHYLIDRDGTVATGRPVSQIGAHVKGRNTGTIGVALIGGFGGSETDHFADHYTPAQERALRGLLTNLSEAYDIKRITGHNQYAAKACPCFSVPEWLKGGAQTVPDAPSRPSAPSTPGNPLSALLRALVAAVGHIINRIRGGKA